MKKYRVGIYVDVIAVNEEDAIIEARNMIFNSARDNDFIVEIKNPKVRGQD